MIATVWICNSNIHDILLQAINQPCAPGTQNRDVKDFQMGDEYKTMDFCTVNLVAQMKYGSQHKNLKNDENKEAIMNERVKTFFIEHYD